MKLALYVRVSTEDQARHGVSLEAQERALENYCQMYNYQVYKIYKDAGKSAKSLKRPALDQLLKDAKEKRFDAILIYKLDRFSRSLKDLILTIEKLEDWGVDFISIQDRIETNTASGKLMFHIISSFAEFERDIIAERTKFGMQQKARSGSILNRAPLGYKIVNKTMIIDEKARLVREIYENFLLDQSINKVAKKYGYTTRGMKKLLTNKAYLGMTRFGEEWRFGKHPPIVSGELFERVQTAVKQRER